MNKYIHSPSPPHMLEEVRELIQKTLDEFLYTKLTQETLYAMQATLVMLFRQMYEKGMVLEEVNPSLVKFQIYENTVLPANEYTMKLFQGYFYKGRDRVVRRYTRYDIALA